MKIFLDILNEKPMAIMWIMVARMAAKIISFNRVQLIKNPDNEGIVIIIAIIVPLIKMPSEEVLLSSNYFSKSYDNKNQKKYILLFYIWGNLIMITLRCSFSNKKKNRKLAFSYPKHLCRTGGTDAFCCWPTIFHGYRFWILHFSFGSTFYTISCCHNTNNQSRYY